MEELKNSWVWVTWSFSDGSKRHILSTLSPELLQGVGVSLKEGFLYDANQREYVAFYNNAIEVTFSKEKPAYESEVLNFASRFI